VHLDIDESPVELVNIVLNDAQPDMIIVKPIIDSFSFHIYSLTLKLVAFLRWRDVPYTVQRGE